MVRRVSIAASCYITIPRLELVDRYLHLLNSKFIGSSEVQQQELGYNKSKELQQVGPKDAAKRVGGATTGIIL